ncbi:hypothetical protein [Burkholderia ubonensis]|uniref:hypothetical protein n=1 Tax=Burkholderia ubonensis TaxID=101571 RepID=UPI000AACEFB7|nr:hypothetical protein [Burkholderia ubonensis]
MNDQQQSRAAVRVCAIADIECSRGCGTGSCKREQPTEQSRADALTVLSELSKWAAGMSSWTDEPKGPYLRDIISDARRILAASPVEQPAASPIPMLLFCPRCGTQHIDGPEVGDIDTGNGIHDDVQWANPPHRSHLCHACGTIWRPADVPTNGVAAIQTRGKADTWDGKPGPRAEATDDRPGCCSGDPMSCPDNEGRGCWCSDAARTGASS